MPVIFIEDSERYDMSKEEFILIQGGYYTFEHSLYTMSRWEEEWKIPFMSSMNTATIEQKYSYYKHMCVDDTLTDAQITSTLINKLIALMNNSATATVFNDGDSSKGVSKVVTTEEIYATMAMAQVPFTCEHWHINRLMTLLRVIAHKNAPKKKMSREEILQQNARLNAERRKQMNSKG